MADMANPTTNQQIVIKSNTIVGTVYSQIVSITITDIDLTLEFVYLNPRPTNNGVPEGEVVARVTLPLEAAKGLPDVIRDTLSKHIEKKGN